MNCVRTDYYSLNQLAERLPIKRSRLKTLLEKRRENGLCQYVRKTGKRGLVISLSGFYEWLEQQKEDD